MSNNNNNNNTFITSSIGLVRTNDHSLLQKCCLARVWSSRGMKILLISLLSPGIPFFGLGDPFSLIDRFTGGTVTVSVCL